MDNALIIKGLNVTYSDGNRTKKIINDLNLTVPCGKITAIVGESGSGKTMTAMAVFGLTPPNVETSGDIYLNSELISALPAAKKEKLRGRDIVLIPQSGADFLDPSMNILSQMSESLRLIAPKKSKAELEKKAASLLESVGLGAEILNKYPHQLSGGMAQKVILAIALSSNPKLVIADEPTRGVDEADAEEFVDKMREVFSESAVAVITHNIAIAQKSDRIAVMFAGEIAETGTSAEVLKDPQHEYTKVLLKSLAENGFRVDEKKNGQSLGGCAYYLRCPAPLDICKTTKPPYSEAERSARCFKFKM